MYNMQKTSSSTEFDLTGLLLFHYPCLLDTPLGFLTKTEKLGKVNCLRQPHQTESKLAQALNFCTVLKCSHISYEFIPCIF